MIVNLFGKKYKVPEHPSEISFGDYISINTYIADKKQIVYEDKVAILALLTKCPFDDLQMVIEDDINMLFSKIKYIHKPVEVRTLKTFNLNGTWYAISNLNNLSVKEYVDIDYYFRQGETVYENLDHIFAIILRKAITKNKSIKDILIYIKGMFKKDRIFRSKSVVKEYEAYEDSNIEDYSDLVYNHFSAEEAIYLLQLVNEMRSAIVKEYNMIFEAAEENTEDNKNEKLSVEEIWGWYHTLNSLTDNDKQKLDYWYGCPIKDLLTHLAYRKQYNIELQKR